MHKKYTFWVVIACCVGMVGPISCKRFDELEINPPKKTSELDCQYAYENIVRLRPNAAGDGSDWVDRSVFDEFCPSWPISVVTCLGTTKKPVGLEQCLMIFPEGSELPVSEEQPNVSPETKPTEVQPRDDSSRRRRPRTIRMRDL